MSELLKAQGTSHSALPALAVVPGAEPVITPAGMRLDPPHFGHRDGGVEPPLPPAGLAEAELSGARAASSGSFIDDLSPGSKAELLLLQAGQIAEHLGQRYAELDRREQRLNGQLVSFDQEQRNLRLWRQEAQQELEGRREVLDRREATLNEREGALNRAELEIEQQQQVVFRAQSELEAERQQLRHEDDRRRSELDRLREEQAAQLQVQRAAVEAERHAQLLEIRRGHDELAQLRERQTAELQQAQTLFENRMRFQQEHLQKSRREFELAQNEFQLQRQAARSEQEQSEIQAGLRARQLHRFRGLLDEREKSLLRDQEALHKARRAFHDGSADAKRRHQEDIRSWEREREMSRSELRRQQDLLALHAENLEARHARLDRLRAELEETHRRTLEMRLAVEEGCAQLSQAITPELARVRIEQAQQALSEHFREARESLREQRQELELVAQTVQKQRDDFRAERQTLAEWMSHRDEELRIKAAEIGQASDAAEARELAWQSTSDRWHAEKLQAEAIIRDLLQQLAEQTTTVRV